jgi:glycine oxidase
VQKFDIVIVGNGILGISTAYALTLEDPRLKIAVIGSFHRKGSATVAAGAMLNCFAEITKFTATSKHALSKFNMAKEALKRWPEWLGQINSELSPTKKLSIIPGTFVLLNTRAGKRESENYAAIHQALLQCGEPHEEVDPMEIPGINPADDSRPLKSLYIPNEGSLNPIQLLHALEEIIVKNGAVTLIDDWAVRLLVEKDKITGVEVQSGKLYQSDRVLLAAGAYSQKLLDPISMLQERIPKILAGPGSSLILKAKNHQFKHVVRTPTRASSCGIHILPYNEKSQLLYMGASNCIRLLPKTQPKGRDVYYLLERAMEQFNQDLHKAELVKWRAGNRPLSFDTFPLIGATSVAGLWMLTGTYRDGFHESPLLAVSLAKAMLGKQTLFWHEFQPERLPIEVMSKQQSIEEFSDQYLSVGYEHGMKLPKIAWAATIEEMVYNRAELIYDALEIDIGLSPDILFMFDQDPAVIPFFKAHYATLKDHFSSSSKMQAIPIAGLPFLSKKKPSDVIWLNLPESDNSGNFIPTLNQTGYATTHLDSFSQEFIQYASQAKGPVLEVGAAYGITTLAALSQGAKVICNDIDPRHLMIIKKQASITRNKSRLTILPGDFSDEVKLPADSLEAILICRVLHLFDGPKIEHSIKKAYEMLKPGGKIFIIAETPYMKITSSFIPEYEKRLKQGAEWPGLIENFQACFKDANNPKMLNLLDPTTLFRVLTMKGFIVEKIGFINRLDFPPSRRWDGREGVGVVAYKPQLSVKKHTFVPQHEQFEPG